MRLDLRQPGLIQPSINVSYSHINEYHLCDMYNFFTALLEEIKYDFRISHFCL